MKHKNDSLTYEQAREILIDKINDISHFANKYGLEYISVLLDNIILKLEADTFTGTTEDPNQEHTPWE